MDLRSKLPVVLSALFCSIGSLAAPNVEPARPHPFAPGEVVRETLEIIGIHYKTLGQKPPASLTTGLGDLAAAKTGVATPALLQASMSALFFAEFGMKDMVLYRDEQLFWALSAASTGCRMPIWFQRKGARLFVQDILLSPAGTLQLKRGDAIVAVNGGPYDASAFYSKSMPCPQIKFSFKHQPWDKVEEASVAMAAADYRSILVSATIHSQRTITIAGKSIGYLHLWTDGEPSLADELKRVAREFNTKTQAFILDLRGGVTGRGDLPMQLFDPDVTGKGKIYGKPLYVLIDHETAGARALLAAHLKEGRLATLVGTPSGFGYGPLTAYLFRDEGWLVRLPASLDKDGGSTVFSSVTPDISGDDTLVYAGGYDAILQAALGAAQK